MRTSTMRREIELKKGWVFTGRDGKAVKVDLPHTWNAVDGQDGGNDYYRGTCHYSTTFAAPDLDSKSISGVSGSKFLCRVGVKRSEGDES